MKKSEDGLRNIMKAMIMKKLIESSDSPLFHDALEQSFVLDDKSTGGNGFMPLASIAFISVFTDKIKSFKGGEEIYNKLVELSEFIEKSGVIDNIKEELFKMGSSKRKRNMEAKEDHKNHKDYDSFAQDPTKEEVDIADFLNYASKLDEDDINNDAEIDPSLFSSDKYLKSLTESDSEDKNTNDASESVFDDDTMNMMLSVLEDLGITSNTDNDENEHDEENGNEDDKKEKT